MREALWLFLGCSCPGWLIAAELTQCFMLLAYPSLLNLLQPVTQLCGSFLEGFQCLNVSLNLRNFKLSAAFFKAELRVGIYRIKKALLPLRHTMFVLFVYTQCIMRLKNFCGYITLYIYKYFTDTPRPFLESLLSVHHPSVFSLSMRKAGIN